MKNKSLLIAVVGLVIISGILIAISTLNINNMSKINKNEIYENKVNTIEKAAQTYVENNKEAIENCSIGNGCIKV